MRAEKPKPEAVSWGGVLGEGQQARSPPARGLGSALWAPQRRPGQSPDHPKVSIIFSSTLKMTSPDITWITKIKKFLSHSNLSQLLFIR